jgi:acyl-coenzyme A thioesterase PaaI-like protein
VGTTFILFVFTSGICIGAVIAFTDVFQTILALNRPPSDSETMLMYDPAPDSPQGKIEAELLAHPLTQKMMADSRFRPSRPHMKIPEPLRRKTLTGGMLARPDGIAVPPMVFTTGDGKELVSITYLGEGVCGHATIVHGGLLATLMDEGLARTCFDALPHKIGFTASLKVDYRAPCKAKQFVVLKAHTTEVKGRKAWVKGRIETAPLDGSDGKLLVEGEALFIEPKSITDLIKIGSSS